VRGKRLHLTAILSPWHKQVRGHHLTAADLLVTYLAQDPTQIVLCRDFRLFL